MMDSVSLTSAASMWRAEIKASRGQSSRRSRSSVASENPVREKAHLPTMPTSVLGDATNTYFMGQRPTIAPDAFCHAKTGPLEQPQRFVKISAQDMDEIGAKSGNAQDVEEYEQDILDGLRRDEAKNLISTTYMDRQVHVNIKMRAILVDWLVDVAKKYKLRSETLFLTVQLIDRYLAVQVTKQCHLQLVGVTALLIAAKFEEIHPPQIKEFEIITDKAYSRDEIFTMEVLMLKALEFKICCPTAAHFLDKYQSVNGGTETQRSLAQYLLELTLVDYKMLKYTPSHLAAASILLSNKLLRKPSWTASSVKLTKLTEPMLKDCGKEMCAVLEAAEAASLQAVRRKFSQPKHNSVAQLNFLASLSGQSSGVSSTAARRASNGGA